MHDGIGDLAGSVSQGSGLKELHADLKANRSALRDNGWFGDTSRAVEGRGERLRY